MPGPEGMCSTRIIVMKCVFKKAFLKKSYDTSVSYHVNAPWQSQMQLNDRSITGIDVLLKYKQQMGRLFCPCEYFGI